MGRAKREVEAGRFEWGVPMLVKSRLFSEVVFLDGDNGDGEKGVLPGPGDLNDWC